MEPGESNRHPKVIHRWKRIVETHLGNPEIVTQQQLAQALGEAETTISRDMNDPDFKKYQAERLKEVGHGMITPIALKNVMKAILAGDLKMSADWLEKIQYYPNPKLDLNVKREDVFHVYQHALADARVKIEHGIGVSVTGSGNGEGDEADDLVEVEIRPPEPSEN